MDDISLKSYTAFIGTRLEVSGGLPHVATRVKEAIERGETDTVLIFNDLNGEITELDLRGTIEDVLKRMDGTVLKGELGNSGGGSDILRGPGRPKLGVVSREVTLLPRHWDWLNSQPGGASVALRKLVDEARRIFSSRDKVRHSQEAAYRFMSAIAGNLPGYEEAIRALFAGNRKHLDDSIAAWPPGLRDYVLKLSEGAFQEKTNDG